MERLCEDELMCIQKYSPREDVGISNERLYNEIKLLDPTFSMMKMYYQLVQWRALMRKMRRDETIYSLYEALRGHRVLHIYEEGITRILTVESKYAADIRDAITALGYTVKTEPSPLGSERMYSLIHISPLYRHDIANRLADVQYADLSHPIRNIQFRYSYMYDMYGYDVYHEEKDEDLYIPRDTYDEDLYRAIRSIDPSIDMNLLYSVYVGKYSRENAVRDMYEEWYPYLGDISIVEMAPEERVIVLFKEDSDLGDILEGVSGWEGERDSDAGYTYTGPDIEAMYDRIQTMLRMYYSYSVPKTWNIGVGYYDTY
jgi:hypothetical protein